MKEAAKLDGTRISVLLICGMLGCLCFGGGDWLMMYGNPAYTGALYWLTDGVANIPAWRNTLAMALSFPGIVLYGIGLFGLSQFIKENRQRKVYGTLTAYGLTPWIALHLFYVMILFLYAWLHKNGYAEGANAICEAIYGHYQWLPLVSELFMIPPFVYWIYLQLKVQRKGMKIYEFGISDHTGIVQKIENGIIYTIEDNSGDSCRINRYAVGHYDTRLWCSTVLKKMAARCE